MDVFKGRNKFRKQNFVFSALKKEILVEKKKLVLQDISSEECEGGKGNSKKSGREL